MVQCLKAFHHCLIGMNFPEQALMTSWTGGGGGGGREKRREEYYLPCSECELLDHSVVWGKISHLQKQTQY
jgi:hypothetical protein